MTVPGASPVPQDVADELRRVVQRWQQLPLDHALRRLPVVRDVLEELAPDSEVPDLGPAVVMDQLTVLVYDACAADRSAAGAQGIQSLLADLRRDLA